MTFEQFMDKGWEYTVYLILILVAIKFIRFLLTWFLVIIEDFVHLFVPPHKHYDLWIFKKLDYIINKFWWND
jgi:hypothetical protein